MTPPASLQRLIDSAAQRVRQLERQHERAQRKAARTGAGPDQSYVLILEDRLNRAKGHLNALKLQARLEQRDSELLTPKI